MPTPHNAARENDFAETVLMPGDPLRAKYIAETFLTDVKLVNSIRNMYAFTGYYKGKRVSIMGSGMGMPSIGLYAHELYTQYNVKNIIRVGSCGAYDSSCKLFDVILVQGASTNSSWANQYHLDGQFSALSSFDLLHKSYLKALEMGARVHVGNILSSDVFYFDKPEQWKNWARMGIIAVEMESYALFATAAALNKKALSILTVSDSFCFKEETTPEERERSFNQMIEIALSLA